MQNINVSLLNLEKWDAEIFTVFESFVYQVAANELYRNWQGMWTFAGLELTAVSEIFYVQGGMESVLCGEKPVPGGQLGN